MAQKAVGLKGPLSTTSSTPEVKPINVDTAEKVIEDTNHTHTDVTIPLPNVVITTEPDTFQEAPSVRKSEPETLLSPLMDDLRQVAEGGSMLALRQHIESSMPEERESAVNYVKALDRLGKAATSAAGIGQEAFWNRFK
jgi:hypothetical protein